MTSPATFAYLSFEVTPKIVRTKINVNFIKVKSHTNVYYNDIVDALAKEALGIK